ncbi:MAG: LacI family DNA-binding transcriptional regulator [Chloroflexota bacterium]
MRAKRPTIKQVAQAAGVSIQTVSRVINDRPDVSPETRERIQNTINELAYQPSALARSLIQRRSYTLGVVAAGLKYIGPSRTLNGITSRAEESGYTLLLKELPLPGTDSATPLIRALLSRHVDGIIWAVPEVGDNHRWIDTAPSEIPAPVIFLATKERPNLSIVNYDNFLGGRLATEHLLEQGYQHIGHITGPLDWWESRERKAGWQAALRAAGMRPLEKHAAEGNWSSASGESAFRQLLDQYPEMDAVFVGNDQMALSVLHVASRRQISVPAQLGVVGFDGLAETPYYSPSLTTVVQDQVLLGSTVVEELVHVIDKARGSDTLPKARTIVLAPELVVRESSNHAG